MLVIKRDGRKESVKFDKITARTKKLEISLNEEENLGSLIIILKSQMSSVVWPE